jgi:hypothetical protein
MRYALGILAVLCLAASAAADPVRCAMRPLANQLTLGVPFGLEVTVENTSDEAMTMPSVQGTETWPWGWSSVHSVQGEWSERRTVHPGHGVIVEDDGDPPITKGTWILGPKSSRRFTVWTWWGDLGGMPQAPTGPIAPEPGKVRMSFGYQGFTPANLPADPAEGKQPKFWRGYAEAPEFVIEVKRVEPAKVVAETLAVARADKAGDVRQLAWRAIGSMTCRYFGKGPGMTDEDLAAAEKWLEANKDKGRQRWIVAALPSDNKDERWCATYYSILVKDPALADALVAALVIPKSAFEVQTYDKVLEALWTNYDDPRALDFARKALRERGWDTQWTVLRLAFKCKVQPIMKEASEALPGWIETETFSVHATEMIKLAGELKIVQAIPVLVRLDREGTIAEPGDLMQALYALEGKNYVPRLIEHVTQNKDDRFRMAAAWYLGRWGDDQCIDALIAALSDPVPRVRANACEALRWRWSNGTSTPAQYDKAMETLINMLASDEAVDRGEVERALMRLNESASVPAEPDRKKDVEFWRGIWQTNRKKRIPRPGALTSPPC